MAQLKFLSSLTYKSKTKTSRHFLSSWKTCFNQVKNWYQQVLWPPHSNVLCISTSFQVLAAPESWLNYFFQTFSTFLIYFKTFSVISHLKSTKDVWKEHKKMWFCLLLKAGRHANAGQLPEGVPCICLFKLIFCWKRLKKVVRQHPKAGLNTQQTVALVTITHLICYSLLHSWSAPFT